MLYILNEILSLVVKLFESILIGVSELILQSIPSRRNENFQADFIHPTKIMSKRQEGFTFGSFSLSIHDSAMNALVVGNSGSGKTSTVLLNTLLKMDGPGIICHDPSGELMPKSSGAKQAQGYKQLVLNLDNPMTSEFYNPLHRIKTISEIKQLSKLLVQTTLGNNTNEKFWNSSAEALITLFIRYVIFHTEKKHHNLFNVLTLLNLFAGSPQVCDKLIISTRDDAIIHEYKSFVAFDAKLLMNILATAKTALNLFSDEGIAQITSRDTIDFESFRKDKVILYIKSNISQMKYFSPICSLFFEQLFASIMERLPQEDDRSIFLLIDEAPVLYLPMLSVAISNIRKYFAGILLVFQTQSQIIDLYGTQQARNIISNCYTKCYLPGVPLETARELELIMGKYEFIDSDNIRRIRPLLSMDEIRVLNESIILCGNKLPVKMRLSRYDQLTELRRLSELPELIIEPKEIINDEYQLNFNTKSTSHEKGE